MPPARAAVAADAQSHVCTRSFLLHGRFESRGASGRPIAFVYSRDRPIAFVYSQNLRGTRLRYDPRGGVWFARGQISVVRGLKLIQRRAKVAYNCGRECERPLGLSFKHLSAPLTA